MAPGILSSSTPDGPNAEAEQPLATGAKEPASTVAEVRAHQVAREILDAVGSLRKQVEDDFDYVGDEFADSVRRMHAGEEDDRGVYGEASAEEIEELTDDGIEVFPLPPKAPRRDN